MQGQNRTNKQRTKQNNNNNPPPKKTQLGIMFKARLVREKGSKKGPKPVQRTDLRMTKSLKEPILDLFPISISSVGNTRM